MFRGGHRLVTVFADNGRYSKPQPSLAPDVDSTLRHIAQWKHLWQIWQAPSTRSHSRVTPRNIAGWSNPFEECKSTLDLQVSMPGSETALKELIDMCRVLDHLLEESIIAQIADDFCCRENSPHELSQNWRKELQAPCTSTISVFRRRRPSLILIPQQ